MELDLPALVINDSIVPASIKILIVGDSPSISKHIASLINHSTILDDSSITVSTSDDALRYLAAHKVDVILLNWGVAASLEVATIENFSSIIVQTPVIVLTEDNNQLLTSKALRKGVQDYLINGQIDLRILEKTIVHAIERHSLLKERAVHLLSIQEAQDRSNRMVRALDLSNQHLETVIAKSNLLATAIEQSAETVIITDTDGIIRYANKSFENISGYSVEEAIGKNPRFLKSNLHDITFYKTLWDSLKTYGLWHGRIKNKKKDGSIYEEDARISCVRDEAGTITNYVAVKRDITHEAALEMQLMQARKLESIGQLAAGIAHEINTPAQYVGDNIRFFQEAAAGFLEAMDAYQKYVSTLPANVQGASSMESLKKTIEDIDLEFLVEETPAAIAQSLDGIERISKIVLAMKDFSHPGTEKMTVNDINKALQSTITVASNEWKYIATVETDLATDIPFVPCFIGELNQVFLNLIINAAHAINAAKRDEGKISIRTYLETPYLAIEVNDNGCGIPEDIKNKIFDPFFTTKPVGRGTGQGLAMAFNTIVEKHKGQLLVESIEGVASTLKILLPLQQSERG